MQDFLTIALNWACWIAALLAIAAYVAALLRNRPYFRPFNALGLLLTGAALLSLPKVIAPAVGTPVRSYAVWVVCLLVAAAILQTISALRRRRRRADDAQAEHTAATVH
jgi:hypothetical protein